MLGGGVAEAVEMCGQRGLFIYAGEAGINVALVKTKKREMSCK